MATLLYAQTPCAKRDGLRKAAMVRAWLTFNPVVEVARAAPSTPLTLRALPSLPGAKLAPPLKASVLPLPEESEAVVPLSSSNFNKATGAMETGGGGVGSGGGGGGVPPERAVRHVT